MAGTAFDAAEQDAVAVVTAAVHDPEGLSDVAHAIGAEEASHRVLVGFVLIERGLEWNPHWQPRGGLVAELVDASRTRGTRRLRGLLGQHLRDTDPDQAGEVLAALAGACAWALGDPVRVDPLLRDWARRVAADLEWCV